MEHRACLVSGRTESITRNSLSALLTLPATQYATLGRMSWALVKSLKPVNALRVAILQQEHHLHERYSVRESRNR